MFDEEEEGGSWTASPSSSSRPSDISSSTQLSEAESAEILIEDFISMVEDGGEELKAFGDLLFLSEFSLDDLEALCRYDHEKIEEANKYYQNYNFENVDVATNNLRSLLVFFKGYEKLPIAKYIQKQINDFGSGSTFNNSAIMTELKLHIHRQRGIREAKRIGTDKEAHIQNFLARFQPSDLAEIKNHLNFYDFDYADLEYLLRFEGIDPTLVLSFPLQRNAPNFHPVVAMHRLTEYFVDSFPRLPISEYLRSQLQYFHENPEVATSIIEGMQSFIVHGREKRTFEADQLHETISPVDVTGIGEDAITLGNEIANGGICSTRTNSILAMLGEIRANSVSPRALISAKNFFDREADYRLFPQAGGDGPLSALQNRIRRSRLESSLKREILHSFQAVGLPIKHKQTGYDVSFGFAENQIGFMVKDKFIPVIALEDNRQIPGIGNCSGTKVNTSLFAKQFPHDVVSLSDDENEIIATIDSSNFMLAQKDSTRGDGFYVVADVLNTFLNALNQNRPERRQASIDRLYDLFAMDIVVCQELGIDHNKSYVTEVNMRNFVNEILSRSNNKGNLTHRDDCDDLDNPANSFEQHVQLTLNDDGSLSINRFLVRDFGKVGNRQDLYVLKLGKELGDVHEEIFNNRVNGLIEASSEVDSVLGDARSIKGLEKILIASRAAHISF